MIVKIYSNVLFIQNRHEWNDASWSQYIDLVNSEKWKISLEWVLFYRVVRVLKALWIVWSETINIMRKLHKTNIFGDAPENFTIGLWYIAPSSGHELMNLDLPFKLILRRFEVVFWCVEWVCCTFWKINGNSFKSTNTILWPLRDCVCVCNVCVCVCVFCVYVLGVFFPSKVWLKIFSRYDCYHMQYIYHFEHHICTTEEAKMQDRNLYVLKILLFIPLCIIYVFNLFHFRTFLSYDSVQLGYTGQLVNNKSIYSSAHENQTGTVTAFVCAKL